MATTFFLKNLPKHRVLEHLSRRYPELKPGAVEATLTLLRVASDILVATDTRMAKNRMSQGKFCVLMQLTSDPAAVLGPSELAAKIGVAKATITGLVDGLERAGLVKRERALADRRAQAVRLTAKGRGFLDQMLPGHYRRTAKLMGRLNVSEQKRLVELLGKVGEGLKDVERDS